MQSGRGGGEEEGKGSGRGRGSFPPSAFFLRWHLNVKANLWMKTLVFLSICVLLRAHNQNE